MRLTLHGRRHYIPAHGPRRIQPSLRSRAATPGEAVGGARRSVSAAARREPIAASAARYSDGGTRVAAAQERASAWARRGDDWSPQRHGAGLVSDMFAHVTIRILEKEYNVACPAEEKASLVASA